MRFLFEYMEQDSAGNALSEEQINFFKNSKIRNGQGKLLKLYHGSPIKTIEIFNSKLQPQFFTQSRKYATEYQSDRDTGEPGKIYEVYLNITKPFDLSTKEQLDVLKDLYIPWLESKGYDVPKEDVMQVGNNVSFAGLADDLYIFLRSMKRNAILDYDGIIVNEGLWKVFDEDFDANISYVPLFENQIKSIYNKTPTGSNNINEVLLESEEPEDYGTGTVVDDDIFDRKTHVSFYDRLFTKPDYMKEEENMVGEVIMMSPQEYFEECAEKIFGGRTSVEQLKRSREINKQNIQDIKDLITKYKRRLFLPYLNYAERQQEGLHRMYVAGELFGWNHKFPVLIINWYDEDRHMKDVERRKKKEILDHIYFNVNNALRYGYSDLEEFENQLEVEFGKYSDDPEIYSIEYDGDTVKVSLVEYPQYVYEFPFDDIKIEEKELDDNILVDDEIDLSDEELDQIKDMNPEEMLRWLEKNK